MLRMFRKKLRELTKPAKPTKKKPPKRPKAPAPKPDLAAKAAVSAPAPSILDQYVRGTPSTQHSLDIFAGEWSSKLPEAAGLHTNGASLLFEDSRITWLLDHLGGVDGFKVLELGPLEAGHSYMLHQAGASVLALEANTRAFLKCLVIKEALGLPRCSFRLGDFVPYLKETTDRFDLLLASGVLYHSSDPIGLLESMARVADRIAIWTHYYDRDVVSADPKKLRMFVPEPEYVEWRGQKIALYRRNYLESLNWAGFCGGPESSAVWMEKAGLLTVLEQLGYARISIQTDDRNHVNGPCIMLCAER